MGRLSKAERAKYGSSSRSREAEGGDEQQGQIGYLTDLADNYVVANTDISKPELDKGGYQIHTTFDKKKSAS